MQQKSCEINHEKPVFGTRIGDKFEWITYKDFAQEVQLFRNVLIHHSIGKGDKVGLICNNRTEWAVAMYAVAGVGGQIVPL